MSAETPATDPAAAREAAIDIDSWTCPVPLRDSPVVVLGHGGGGALSAELIEHLFLPGLDGGGPGELTDSATFEVGGVQLAFSTDSYVVRPMFFPGGSIGDLAVNGTVNDLAMSGARPLYLSSAFILEEGTELSVVGRIAQAMGRAAERAGVRVVTGDTKVVDAGHGDQVYVNTAGVGVVPDGVDIRPGRARPGDVVIVSGDLGVHGIAVTSVREGLEFETPVVSDTAPLHDLVATMLAACPDLHVLRDPTRGGLAASLNEIAAASGTGVNLVEASLPVPPEVVAACGFLGLDPLYVANEGKLVAFVPREHADAVLAAMRGHEHGCGARIVGEVVADHPGMVVARTGFGGTRVVDLPLGELLPRIC